MTLCMWFTSRSLFLFSCILLLPLQQPPPCQSIPSVHPACMPGGLLLTCHRRSHRCRPHRENSPPRGYPARGQRDKVRTKWGAKAGNSLHVRKPNPEIIVTWADNFPFTVPLHLHWRLHFPRPERTLATVLLLHTGRTHFCTQGIYLKSHSQAVLQAWNRNSPDCSPVSQQWYGLKIETWTDLTGLKSPLDGIFNFSECFDKWLYF